MTQHHIGKGAHTHGHHPTSETIDARNREYGNESNSNWKRGRSDYPSAPIILPKFGGEEYTGRPRNYGQGVRLLAFANSSEKSKKTTIERRTAEEIRHIPHQAPTPRSFSSSPAKYLSFSSRSLSAVEQAKAPIFGSLKEGISAFQNVGAKKELHSFDVDGRIYEIHPQTISGESIGSRRVLGGSVHPSRYSIVLEKQQEVVLEIKGTHQRHLSEESAKIKTLPPSDSQKFSGVIVPYCDRMDILSSTGNALLFRKNIMLKAD